MHKNPALTVDAVIVKDGKIVLIKRKEEPFQGQYALPGGFVEYGETVEAALRREVLRDWPRRRGDLARWHLLRPTSRPAGARCLRSVRCRYSQR